MRVCPRRPRARDRQVERADDILARLATVIEVTPFEFLRGVPPDHIANFLRQEHPQTVALVIANMPNTVLAAQVMQQLPPEQQPTSRRGSR